MYLHTILVSDKSTLQPVLTLERVFTMVFLLVAMTTSMVFTVPVVNSLALANIYKITCDDVTGRRGQVLSVKSAAVCSMT